MAERPIWHVFNPILLRTVEKGPSSLSSQWSLALYKASFPSVLYEFALSRGESNKTNANKVSYKTSYEAPLTRKIRLYYNKHNGPNGRYLTAG